MITRENYSVFMDDFIAGNLSAEMEEAYLLFLEANPDLMELDIEASDAKLEDSFLSQLKKPILLDEKNLDEALIAQLEGDLSKEEEEKLEAYLLAHPEKEKDRTLMALTVLRPSISEQFPNKSSLHKKTAFRIGPALWYSAAASVLIASLWIYGTNRTSVNALEPVFTQVDKVPGEEVKPKAFEEAKTELHSSPKPEKGNPFSPAPVKREEKNRYIPIITPSEPQQKKSMESLPILTASLTESEPSLELNQVQIAHLELDYEDVESEQKNQDLTILQYAYKKLRKTAGADELVVAENEIPQDAAALVAEKVKTYVGFSESSETVSFRIGSFELKRRKR